jgi:hypothetical protein
VRPISSDRYGFLVRLTPSQTARLRAQLDDLEVTKAAELGPYDFNGEKGFHCVSWFTRIPIGDEGENLLSLLGGKPEDGHSMPDFARFVERTAPSHVLYTQDAIPHAKLATTPLRIITLEELEKAWAARPLR